MVLLAAAQAGVPVREATPNEIKVGVTGYGAADKAQVGQDGEVIRGRVPEVPPRRHRRRAGGRDGHRRTPSGPGCASTAGNGKASVLDRAAVDPITRGETPYERAVREALGRPRRWRGPASAAR